MASEAIPRFYYHHDSRLVKPVASFFHNSVHDMESIHWVLFLLLKDIQVVRWDEQAEQHWITILHELFPGEISRAASRRIFLTYPTDATSAYGELLGVDGHEVYGRVMDMGPLLVRYYRKLEAQFPDGPVDINKVCGIHEEFHGIWSDCIGYLSERDLCLSYKLHTKPVIIVLEDRGPWRRYKFNF